uniref:Adenosine kinase n=1 Tax=Macrostomum lignano TaxID=282301 RepID=A0A1I8FA49_9PLAT
MSTTGAREGLRMGMANPLLDLANTIDAAYLAKYNLKPNDAILAGPEHAQIFDDLIGRPDTQYIPGGATQNAIRVAQWLLRTPKATSMFGCVRLDDDIGKRLRDCMETAGVRPAYQCLPNSEPTGRCGRADLPAEGTASSGHPADGKALASSPRPLVTIPPTGPIVEAAYSSYYVAGFFLTPRPSGATRHQPQPAGAHHPGQGSRGGRQQSDGSVTEFPVRQLAPHELVDTTGRDAFAGGFIAPVPPRQTVGGCIELRNQSCALRLFGQLQLHNAPAIRQGYAIDAAVV